MLIKRSHLMATAVVVLTLGMAGCGGGDGDISPLASTNTGASPGAGPGTSPGAGPDAGSGAGTGSGQTSDTFISKVMQIIGMTAENTEPLAIDAITVTSPDNTEPVPIS